MFGCAALPGGGAGPGAAGGSPGRLGPRDPEPHPGDSSWELGYLGVCFVDFFFLILFLGERKNVLRRGFHASP